MSFLIKIVLFVSVFQQLDRFDFFLKLSALIPSLQSRSPNKSCRKTKRIQSLGITIGGVGFFSKLEEHASTFFTVDSKPSFSFLFLFILLSPSPLSSYPSKLPPKPPNPSDEDLDQGHGCLCREEGRSPHREDRVVYPRHPQLPQAW